MLNKSTKTNIYVLILYIFSLFLFGYITYFLKFWLTIQKIYVLYKTSLEITLLSFWVGAFLWTMIIINNKLIHDFKYGQMIGLIGASLMPIIWTIIIILSALGFGREGYTSLFMSQLIMILADKQILSYYIILMTMLIFNNFINRVHGIIHERGNEENICSVTTKK